MRYESYTRWCGRTIAVLTNFELLPLPPLQKMGRFCFRAAFLRNRSVISWIFQIVSVQISVNFVGANNLTLI